MKKGIEIQPGFEPGSGTWEKCAQVLTAHMEYVAAAITQFAGGSTKYFGTYHAELKPEKDPA